MELDTREIGRGRSEIGEFSTLRFLYQNPNYGIRGKELLIKNYMIKS